jgi:polysaccharide export outer membrane protein
MCESGFGFGPWARIRMRLRQLLMLLLAASALAGCAGPAHHHARQAYAQARASELDLRMYGAPAMRQHPQSARRRASPAPQRPAARPLHRVVPAPVPVPVFRDGPYTLDTGDKLRVVVFGQDALSNNYIVDAEGRIALPLIGPVGARGLTTTQLSGAIKSRLAQSFIRDPSVAVEVEVHRPFFVLGEVTFPGQYPYVPNMTVENAIAIAGGFTPRAFKDTVTVTRKLTDTSVRAALPLRHPLRPGDTVTVDERWF